MELPKKAISGLPTRVYRAGDLYSFRTSPTTEFSPKETGRYAALKILGFKKDLVCIAVLDGIFDRHPALADIENLPIAKNTRFVFKGDPACCLAEPDADNPLDDLKYIGNVTLTTRDTGILSACVQRFGWIFANVVAEGEWRWKHDRAAYTEEVRLNQEAAQARMEAKKGRLKNRLKTLTWDVLLAEKPFARWDSHPPLAFTEAARAQIHAAVRSLQALGPKPKKHEVRDILKSCVEWFNVEDAEFGHVIETEEAEDILTALEELAYVAGQKALVSEIDDWREW